MSGLFVRLDNGENKEVEQLSAEELEACFGDREPRELVRWIESLCWVIRGAEVRLKLLRLAVELRKRA